MQTVLTYLMMVLTGLMVHAQNTIEVTLTQFKSDEGTAMVGLYNEESKFLDETYLSLSTSIKDRKANVTFKNVPDGIYAISSYHDEDDSGELNMFLGMFPTESYGCSNGARGHFGPPTWEDAKFEVKDGEVRKFIINL